MQVNSLRKTIIEGQIGKIIEEIAFLIVDRINPGVIVEIERQRQFGLELQWIPPVQKTEYNNENHLSSMKHKIKIHH